MKRASLALGLFILLASVNTTLGKPVPKEVGEALRLKFDKGSVYFLEIKTHTKQKMKLMQQDVDQDQDQVAVIQVSPLERKDGGDWIVGMSIVGMRFKMNIGGSVVEFDSAKPMQGSPGVSYLEPLFKAKF